MTYDSTHPNTYLEYHNNVMNIFKDLKEMEYKIKVGKVKWASDSEILEGIVLTILNLAKTINSTQGAAGGNVEMPNHPVVCFC